MRNGKRNGYAWFRMLCTTASIMLLLLCAAASFAEGTIVFEGDETITRVSGETGGLSNNQAAAGYINRLMKGGKSGSSGLVGRGTLAGDQLSGAEKKLYKKLKEKIEAAAAGNADSTEFLVPYSDIFGAKGSYTLAELGFSEYNDGNSEAVCEAFTGKYQVNVLQVMDALLADCPYDLYWYDKTVDFGYGTQNGRMSFDEESSIVSYVDYKKEDTSDKTSLIVSMVVAQGYRDGSEYQINTTYGTAAAIAAQTARGVVADNAGKNDFEKLTAYKNWICNHVDYNDDAAKEENNTPYGDPWQMVWVFDDNSSTNVVCEGYSKAFQYLCDESEFTENVTSILATGWMEGGTGAGAHMWNLVQMDEGGSWYLVDVTNSDAGSIGASGGLFLDGYDNIGTTTLTQTGSNGEQTETTLTLYNYYVNDGMNTPVGYAFDEEIQGLYGAGYPQLSEGAPLSGEAFQEAAIPDIRVNHIGLQDGLTIELYNAENVGSVQVTLQHQDYEDGIPVDGFTASRSFEEQPASDEWITWTAFSAEEIASYAEATGNKSLIRMKTIVYDRAYGSLLVSRIFYVRRGTFDPDELPRMLLNGKSEDLTVPPFTTVHYGASVPEGTTGIRMMKNNTWEYYSAYPSESVFSNNEYEPDTVYTCYVQITKDEFDPDQEGWMNNVAWGAVSDPVVLKVTRGVKPEKPEFTLNTVNGTIPENRMLEITIDNIPEGTGYRHYRAVINRIIETDNGETMEWAATSNWDRNTEKLFAWTGAIPESVEYTQIPYLGTGNYEISIVANLEGYAEGRSASQRFTVTPAEESGTEARRMWVSAEEIPIGVDLKVIAYDPEADSFIFNILKDGTEQAEPGDSNGPWFETTTQFSEAGTYTIQFMGKKNGSDESWLIGEKTVTVTSRGALDDLELIGVHDVYSVGEVLDVSFDPVPNAESYDIQVSRTGDDGESFIFVNQNAVPGSEKRFSFRRKITEPGTYFVSVAARAPGYQSSYVSRNVLAIDPETVDGQVQLTVGGETGETEALANEELDVRIRAEQATAVRFLQDDGNWIYTDENGKDDQGDFHFRQSWREGRTYTLIAQATYDPLDGTAEEREWWSSYNWEQQNLSWTKNSNTVTLTVTKYGQAEAPSLTILNAEGTTIPQGGVLRVKVDSGEHTARTLVSVRQNYSSVFGPEETDPDKDFMEIDTIYFEPGKYLVSAYAEGEPGYTESSDSEPVEITVTEPETGKIWINREDGYTGDVGEEFIVRAYQPGGSMKISYGYSESTFTEDGNGFLNGYRNLIEGTYVMTVTVYDAQGTKITEKSLTLTGSYSKGYLSAPVIHAPLTATPGEDYVFTVEGLKAEGVAQWNVDIRPQNGDGHPRVSWYSGFDPSNVTEKENGVLEFTVPGSRVKESGSYTLSCRVDGENGYGSANASVKIHIPGERDQNLTLSVKKAGAAAFSSSAEYNAQANETMYGRITVTGDRKPTMIMVEIPHSGERWMAEDAIEQTGEGEYTAWPGEFYFDSNGDYLVTAWVSYEENPDDQENFTWAGESNSIAVHVTSAGRAIPGTITLKENTVARGVPLEVQVGAGTHVSDYNVNFMVSGGNASEAMSTRTLRQPGTVYMATTDLEPGTYNVEVYCRGEQNYESAASEWVPFTVTDGTGAAEFLFDASQEVGVSQDEVWFSMYYPEATRYRLYWEQDGKAHSEDIYAWNADEPVEYDLTLETGVTKAWAEAWKWTEDGDQLIAESKDIEFTVTELYPDYAISVSLDQDMNPVQDHTITVDGLADADRWWAVDLLEFKENDGGEGWETILTWANWKGDLPGALVIPAGTMKIGGQYRIAAEAVRYGSDQVSANRRFDLCPDAPAVTVDNIEPLVHDYVRFSVADPEIDEIRYTYEIGEGADSYENNRTLDSWEIQRKNGTSIWRFYMNQEGTRTYSFSFRKGDTWTGWTEPITITASYAGDLSVPVLTVPETLRAGEPFSVQIGKVEHADRFSVSWREKASFHPYSISVFSAGETVPERFGLDAGEYEVWVTAFGKHYRESESAFYTVSVTGERPAAPVPDTTRISGVKAGDRLVISATAENGSRVALITPWDQLGEDLYLTENGKVQVPFTVENPDISIYLQSLVDGCWSEPSDGIQVQGEQDIGDEVQIPVTVNPSTVSQGQDVQVTINKVAGAGLYTYNVCYLDPSEDPDEPIPVNVVYETAANPVFNGNRGTFTIPAYYFRYVGQYTVTVNAYQDDVWQSYMGAGTADLTVNENTDIPEAPTATLEKDSYPYFSTVTAQVQTGGAERLVAYLLNEYGGNQYTSFTTEIIELEENQTSYEYSWLAEEPGEYALAFAVYRNGVLSRGSEKLSFTVDVPQGRLAAPKLTAPDRVTRGEAMSVSWTPVEGAESYIVEIDDAETQVVYASGVIPANQTSLEIPADELTDSGRMTVWVEARAAGMDKSWSTEKVFALEDPETAPSVVTKFWTGGTLTLEVSGITGDRLAVKINGSDAGYVAITGSGSTQTVKVPVTADTEYVQVANRATDGFNWSTFSNKAYPLYANTLKLPEGLTEIESEAFSGLAEPVNIILPAGVTRIADDAFEGSTVMLIVRNEYAEGWARDKGYSYMVQK